jgi:hypothetical protein
VAQGISREFKPQTTKKEKLVEGPDAVAQDCSPTSLGDEDGEDLGSRPVQAKSSQGHISTNG